jgi:hypothetical protein
MSETAVKVYEKRSYFRGHFSFEVRYRVLSPEAYHAIKQADATIADPKSRKLKFGTGKTDIQNIGNAVNDELVDFLQNMDEKVKLILTLLTDKDASQELIHEGLGVNLSASGMKMITDEPVETKQVLHASIILSKVPCIQFDVFGKIIRTEPVAAAGKTVYHVGVQFKDLDASEKDDIISCVFQKERQATRKQKMKDQS